LRRVSLTCEGKRRVLRLKEHLGITLPKIPEEKTTNCSHQISAAVALLNKNALYIFQTIPGK
jgi:hypothetical protein